MSKDDAEKAVQDSLGLLNNLDTELRERAFRSVNAYIQYIYATATGGAGPVAVPPSPAGSTSPTTGIFKCPKCNYNGSATYK